MDGVYYSVRFANKVTIFHFDPDDGVKCNFVFPDGRRRRHREEGAHHGRFHTDVGELVRVPRARASHAVDGDGHGDAAAGGHGGPRVAVVDGQAPPAFKMGCRCHARRPYWATPPAQFWMHGEEARAASRSCPRDHLAPPSPARRVLRAVGWPRRCPQRLTRT